MIEINKRETEEVSAGFAPPTNIHPGMNANIAVTSFRGLGLVGASFAAGFAAGGWLAANTGIDEWLADKAWTYFR